MKTKELFQKYWHFLLLLYLIPYEAWFTWLQYRSDVDRVVYHVISSPLDSYIPFCEFFILPYVLWFAYLGLGVLYFILKSKKDFVPMWMIMITGMTLALITYTVWPSTLELREPILRNNVFTAVVDLTRSIDPPNNVCPSIHVFSTLALHTAFFRSAYLKEKKYGWLVRYGSLLLAILICASTVFIKQHSIVDVFASIGLFLILYLLVYRSRLFDKFFQNA